MDRILPVTLVCGFLGAGKTSLLHHFLSERATSPIAVLIEGENELGLDARALRGLCGAMRRTEDIILDLPAAGQLDWLAAKLEELHQAGRIEQVLIEVAATTDTVRFARLIQQSKRTPLRQIICLVDAFDFHRTFVQPEARPDAAPLSLLISAPIRCADLLVLNKCDLLAEPDRDRCLRSLGQLNSRADLIETAYGELNPEVWDEAGPKRSPPVAERDRESTSETEIELSTILYRVHRPFHPARFWTWFESDHPGLLRVKGLIWLATRNLLVGGISRTRWQNSCGGAGIWWAALPREEWPFDPEALQRMQENWREPFGDRRQEVVLLGEASTLPTILRQLQSCLLTDAEYALAPHEWNAFPDPFPAWDIGEGS